ncbi:MAG: hypothetical protein HN725_00120 [Alphaproteobacteria bacterium]|jgi:hypothetical protein|nr:hypothetical protein [Alphaproteobacteria bacterium]MBT4084330.1 hypothetical protein [Alphaproteobacteria bacterium]MBT4542770.1 hypothetical protein [Alphaproteobacteria bacterium]MBT7743661.1 hypothetical protein [Alphaproteobacteria bacterium]
MTDQSKINSEVDQELDALAAIIKRAERDLADDKLLTIGGLPERTQAVCNKVADMPVEDGRQFETRLNALISELDALGRNISSQQAELAERLTKMAEENPEQNESDQS